MGALQTSINYGEQRLLKRLDCINNTKPGSKRAKTKTFPIYGLLPTQPHLRNTFTSISRGAFARPKGQQETGMNIEGKEGGQGQAKSISIISASAAWLADVKAE